MNLARKNGGSWDGVTHCRLYVQRPLRPLARLLCAGDADHPPCPDLATCCALPWRRHVWESRGIWLMR